MNVWNLRQDRIVEIVKGLMSGGGPFKTEECGSLGTHRTGTNEVDVRSAWIRGSKVLCGT